MAPFQAEIAFVACVEEVNQHLSAQLKLLLETKHLYQKLSLDLQSIIAKHRASVLSGFEPNYDRMIKDQTSQPFVMSTQVVYVNVPAQNLHIRVPQVTFVLQNVLLSCASCKKKHGFRPIFHEDITQQLFLQNPGRDKFKITWTNDYQLFVLAFQCQGCEGKPNGFLVSRDASSLRVEGRSPMEYLEVPKFIPDSEQKWFREAIIAYQAGKTLAGLFYLRTFIEQFARRWTSAPSVRLSGDEIMDAYFDTIPLKLRDFMPSLREWYDKISDPLHSAREDGQVFEAARSAIEKHFQIREVHELDSTGPFSWEEELDSDEPIPSEEPTPPEPDTP